MGKRLIDNAKKKVFNLIENTVFILLILFKIYIFMNLIKKKLFFKLKVLFKN